MQNARLHPRSGFPFDPASVISAIERTIAQADNASYPPFNIIQTDEDTFAIEMALAGFSQDEISIEIEGSALTISADGAKDAQDERTFLHRGIARRSFKRTFRLGEHMQVKDAEMTDGVLKVSVIREVPEEKKPRRLEINRPA
jgi:molecular chaperone IbpA